MHDPIDGNAAATRVRLLWLIDSLNVGGAESLVLPFAKHLDRSRFELFVCCLKSSGENIVEQELRSRGVPTHNLHARNLRDLGALRRLIRFVRENGIELIHAHLTYSAIWSALVSRLTGVPSVVSLHVATTATRQQEKSVWRRSLVDVRDRLMRFFTNRWAARVVMVSAALRDYYLRSGGLEAGKVRVVHNGIEIAPFARDHAATRRRLAGELGIPPAATIAVTVSVLRAGKGIEVLLEAVRHLPDITFIIVGDGAKRQEWEDEAKRAGIAERVRWTGYRRDVDSILAGCDVFIHPSLDDAFPTVLLEAMAAGLPVIASAVGGIPEIVIPGVTGALVPPGDSSALAAAVTAMLSDRAQMAKMSEHAREAAERHFSTQAWLARLSSLYEEVLKETSA